MNRFLCLAGALTVGLLGCGGLAPADDPNPTPAAPSGPSTKPPATNTPPTSEPSGGSDPVSHAACPDSVPAPTSCGDWVAECAGAEAVAVGTFSNLAELAVAGSAVYFRTDYTDLTPDCTGTVYMVTPAGNALLAVGSGTATAIAAEGSFLYWSDGTNVSIHGTEVDQTMSTSTPGETPVELTTTTSGVIVVTSASVYSTSGASLLPLGQRPWKSGARMAYDGVDVFSSFPGSAEDNDSFLVRLAGASVDPLAWGASTRFQRTIAADSGTVYFVTGDAMSMGGKLFRPMGISSIPKLGTPATSTVLVPSADEVIDSLTIDAQNVYFTVGNEIRRVPRAGGPVTLVKALGAPPRDLFVTDTSLYFRLEVQKRRGEISGPGGVIARIAK